MRYLIATWAILVLSILMINCSETDSDRSLDLSRWSSPSADPVWAPIAIPTPTPVASPTPVPSLPSPSPTPASPQQVTERQELVNFVHETFPDNARMGNVVVWRESLNYENWRDYVYGGSWSATSDCGLMQIHWPTHADKFAAHDWTQQDCFDPTKNLIIAREIYDTSGPWAWTTY